MTRFILDSGDPKEYLSMASLTKSHGQELWGGTTNPSLIAKTLTGKKLTSQEAFDLQKEIVYEILDLVPGAVSAEVYADLETTGEQMAEQGREIASWHERIAVKLPTTIEGFKARTLLRKENIITNNTLVFSQQQIFAICLHEHIVTKTFSLPKTEWPSFISPFVGRLDDIGENGLSLVQHGMKIKQLFPENLWMLEASVRSNTHIKAGIELGSELITVPAKMLEIWFSGQTTTDPQQNLTTPDIWEAPTELLSLSTIDDFMEALTTKRLAIDHPLTEKGIIRFTEDWQAILK